MIHHPPPLSPQVCRISNEGAIACISCPSLYRALRKVAPGQAAHLLEFDQRLAALAPPGGFTLYDYNEPESVPDGLRGAFSVVVCDPPYLSE